MSRKIALRVGGRVFDVNVADDFALFLDDKMKDDFNVEGNNEIKVLLKAYIKKSHELFLQEQGIQNILKDCEDL